MSWLSNLVFRYPRNLHLALLLLFSLILIVFPSRVGSLVSEALLGSVYYPFIKLQYTFGYLASLRQQNSALRLQLTTCSNELSVRQATSREVERLRAALGFESPPGYLLTPARVQAVSSLQGRIPQRAVISKGTRDSILVDQPIINQDGLLGRVQHVERDHAFVQLLTDPSNRVSARVARTRELGIARYKVEETGMTMILDNFPVQGDVRVGDTIVSSGMGRVYPPDLLIGYVAEVTKREKEQFYRIRLVPAASFLSLEEVFVMRPESQ